jgi:hypothetical protein
LRERRRRAQQSDHRDPIKESQVKLKVNTIRIEDFFTALFQKIQTHPKSCRCSYGITTIRKIAAVCGVNVASRIAVAAADVVEPSKIIYGGFV